MIWLQTLLCKASQHPFRLLGAVIERGTDPMLIMEFMEHGSLQEVLLNPTMVIESDLIMQILKDIAQGVRFLHSSNPPVIHGDLKSGNVLIDLKFRAKLSDFGLSKRKPDKATGTPLWMAPELLAGQSMNTPKSDMYSVGIIMYEVVSRKEPYHEATESNIELLRAIADRRKSKRPRIPTYCPTKVKKLIKFLWHADPAIRPSARELDNRLQEMDATVFDSCALAERGHRPDKPSQGDQEHFLYQAFPRHVADVLKAGGKMEPESHDNITIFFSDIVGFTSIASQVEPLKVSQMLDRLYTKFDKLSQKYDVFKVETIGDAYMCAGNLAQDQRKDHVKRIALFAIDAIQGAAETLIDEDDTSRGFVKIRAGFHSGPVVSNVVGSLNPRYGVFGDTVNVAARMETNSEEGRIHCSKASAKQLMRQAPDIPVILRGEMQIKGKGKMTTYWVG
jgi:class 3 adenylate cyclase